MKSKREGEGKEKVSDERVGGEKVREVGEEGEGGEGIIGREGREESDEGKVGKRKLGEGREKVGRRVGEGKRGSG